jgi:hypothetical protein
VGERERAAGELCARGLDVFAELTDVLARCDRMRAEGVVSFLSVLGIGQKFKRSRQGRWLLPLMEATWRIFSHARDLL